MLRLLRLLQGFSPHFYTIRFCKKIAAPSFPTKSSLTTKTFTILVAFFKLNRRLDWMFCIVIFFMCSVTIRIFGTFQIYAEILNKH